MKYSRVFLLTVLWMMVAAQAVLAYTSDDYYQAGKKLYVGQNYDQAIKYFAAALQLDPNNAGALQARANCYYISGQYQNALNDYQKVLDSNPSNAQLANFVERVKAKLAGASSASPAASSFNSNGSYTQGVALFQQKQYAQAIPYFEQAAQQDPRNSKIYYYLGITHLMVGDKRSAALNLALSNQLNPNPSVDAYVKRLRAGLSPDDQQWVDANLSRSTGHAPSVGSADDSKKIGVRLEPGIGLVALGDFNTDAQTRLAIGQAEQQLGDASYQFTGAVPAGYPDITLEPTVKVLPFLELGLPLTGMFVGNYTFAAKDNSGFSDTGSYSISAFGVGINARVFYGDGPVKLFAAAGPVMVPVSLAYTESPDGSQAGSYTETANTSSMAFGGQAQLGADLHLGGGLLVSAYVGYRAAPASGLTGTATENQGGVSQTAQGEFYMVKTSYGNLIEFVQPDNVSSLPSGSRPLNVDLSSILSGIQLSLYF
jgi:tetratricopeptide (TPR) repeat protein